MSKILLYQGQPGTSSAVAVAADSATRTIDAATVCNPTVNSAWLSVWLVQDGDTAADDTILRHQVAVNAGVTESIAGLINQCIPPNAEIHLAAETAAALTVTISGRN